MTNINRPPFLEAEIFLFIELFADVIHSVTPAKAGIQNRLNPAPSGTGFRVPPGLRRGGPE